MVSFALPNVGFASRNLLWVLATATALMLLLAVLSARMLPEAAPQWRILSRLPRRLQEGVQRYWPRAREGLEVIRSPRLLCVALAFNLFGWLVDILISWAFGRAFNLGLPLAAYVSVTVVIGLLTIFPVTFGNVGTFELAVVGALSLYGVSSHEALAYAVGTHLFSTLFNVGLGVVAMLLMGMHPGEVFRLRRSQPDADAVANPISACLPLVLGSELRPRLLERQRVFWCDGDRRGCRQGAGGHGRAATWQRARHLERRLYYRAPFWLLG
jgi:hypothetical protein